MPAQESSNASSLKIALIGCGKMGSAMLKGWLSRNIAEKIYVLDPAGPPEEFMSYIPEKIVWFKDSGSFQENDIKADIYVMAVKPQIMKDVCHDIAPSVPANALILSIAAGQTISLFEQYFGTDQPVIRTMPNTPAAIGKGMSVAVGNGNVTSDQRKNADQLMATVGLVEWLDNETLLNAVTAVSGSGPAYVFHLVEAMAEAGTQCGLEQELAMKLARQTIIGSAALIESEKETPVSTLRENVTSPGGTTAAALSVLMQDDQFKNLMADAIEAATNRGKELASS